jgi:hypothetical protein
VTELEQQLARLRDDLVWPPTPDLAGAVAARIAGEPRGDRARRWPAPTGGGALGRVTAALRGPRVRTAAVAMLVAVVALAATLAAAPGVRARIADWLGIGAVRIERVERLPDTSAAAGLGLGTRTTLAAARRTAGVPVPTITALGSPDAVYVDRRSGGSASLVYLARPGLPAATRGVGALLTMLPGGDPLVVKKLLGAGTSVQSVDVDGGLGVFVSGEPHVVSPPNRLAGNTVLWVRGDTTYRLETALGRDAALRLARSVR